MKASTPSFRGMAPRITPRALPENASQEAINAKLLTGDLGPWHRPGLVIQIPVPVVTCVDFTEDFANGLTPYTTYVGSSSLFAIVSDDYGNALSCLAQSGTTQVQGIIRDIPAMYSAGVRAKFVVNQNANGDSGTFVLTNASGASAVFSLVPRRESFIDPSRRVECIWDGETFFASPASVDLAVWYEIEVLVLPGAGNSTWQLRRLDTMAVVGSGNLSGSFTAVPVDSLLFLIDGDAVGTANSYFDDIVVICD